MSETKDIVKVLDQIKGDMDRQLDAFGSRFTEMDLQFDELVKSGASGGIPKVVAEGDFITKDRPLESHPAFRGPASDRGSIGNIVIAAANPDAAERRGIKLNDAERKALGTVSGPSGGYLTTPQTVGVLDRVRNATQVVNAGARIVPETTGEVSFPMLNGSVDPAWKQENAAVSEDAPVFDRVYSVAKTCAVMTYISVELNEDMGREAGDIIERDLTAALALKLDHAALYGAGSLIEPVGLRNVPGITSPIAENGAVPTDYDFLSDAVYRVQDENYEPNGMIYSPRTANTFRKLKTDTEGLPLPMHPDLARIPRYVTNQIPNTLDEGTATGECSDLFLGDWSNLAIVVRPQLGARVISFMRHNTMSVGLVAWLRADVVCLRPDAFTIVTGIKAA